MLLFADDAMLTGETTDVNGKGKEFGRVDNKKKAENKQ